MADISDDADIITIHQLRVRLISGFVVYDTIMYHNMIVK